MEEGYIYKDRDRKGDPEREKGEKREKGLSAKSVSQSLSL